MFVRYDYSNNEIIELYKKAETKCLDTIEKIISIPLEEKTFKNTVESLENTLSDYSTTIGLLTFMSYVSTDENIRKDSAQCQELASKFSAKLFSRKDVYLAVKNYTDSTQEELNSNQKRLLELYLREFEEEGLHLEEDKLEKLREIKEKLGKLSISFSINLNENDDNLELTKEELDGLNESFIERLEKKDDKYIVPMKATFYEELMKNAKVSETRKRAYILYQNKEKDRNVKLLEEALILRQDKAKLLGNKNHVDYATRHQMAKSQENVKIFLEDLIEKIKPRYVKELEQLSKLKEEEEGNSTIYQWDVEYYFNKIQKEEYGVNNDLIKEYFPLETVMSGMFDIYSKIFGITFHEIKNADTWAEDVKLYEIREGNDPISYFYADLFPRKGKYNHAAAFTLISGKQDDNNYRKPVSAIVANMTAPTKTRPSLLTHREVETLFHEFGHIMHQTLTKAPYPTMSGSSTTRDFVEAPSQLMENWCWQKESLPLISGHFKNKEEKLPQELLEKMIASKNFNSGYFYTRQLFLATLDMIYHTTDNKVNTSEIYQKLFKDILLLDPSGVSMQSRFGHLMSGYSGKYYSYMWSKVYAEDIFKVFEENGIFSQQIGKRYKKMILEKGYMEEPDILLKNFLEREPDKEPFLKSIGIGN